MAGLPDHQGEAGAQMSYNEQKQRLILENSACAVSPTSASSLQLVSTKRNAKIFSAIIFGNSLVSCGICINFWAFAKYTDLSQWERRGFNIVTLFLSAALGFGIGFLCDRIGLLARGKLLESRANPIDDIGDIMRGSLSGYSVVFARRMFPTYSRNKLKPNLGPVIFVVFVFMVLSVLGRFSVALLGFAYNLDDKSGYEPPLYRPDWVNGTLPDGMNMTSGNSEDHDHLFSNFDIGAIIQSVTMVIETFRMPPPLRRQPLNETEFERVIDLQEFSMPTNYLDIKDSWGGPHPSIVGTYWFQDFKGSVPQRAEWKALVDVHCTRHNLENTVPDLNAKEGGWNQSIYFDHDSGKNVSIERLVPAGWNSSFQWILPDYQLKHIPQNVSNIATFTESDQENIDRSRNSSTEIFLLAMTRSSLGSRSHPDGTLMDVPIVKEDFMSDTPLLFRCNYTFKDVATGKGHPSRALQFPPWSSAKPKSDTFLGVGIYLYLKQGPVYGVGQEWSAHVDSDKVTDHFRNKGLSVLGRPDPNSISASSGFDYGIGRRNSTASELWLASYIANHIGLKLSYLNGIIRRIEIEPEDDKVITTLVVKWWRAAAILGGLLIFQAAFASVAIAYCHGSIELEDEVATYENMFVGFPLASEQQSQTEKRSGGKCAAASFVPENGGYRWVVDKKKIE